MASRPDNLETLTLALEILKRIPRRALVTATELHAQLQAAGISRDKRTIQRQLEMLSEHFDIERDDRTKPYGYRWKPNAAGLSVPGLGRSESLLLLLAERQLKGLLPAQLMKSMEGFFAQARRQLDPTENARREREWLSKVRVVSTTQPLLPPRIAPGVFEQVSDALYENRWLEIEYRNRAGKLTKGEVMPLGLAQQGVVLYLVARYVGFENERSLALHRVLSARKSQREFVRPKEFDLASYDDDGRFGFGEGGKVRLRFDIDRAAGLHLLETPLSIDQKVVDKGEVLQVSATVTDTQQLEWWLRGFGSAVRGIRKVRI